jgi:hypothetical protein
MFKIKTDGQVNPVWVTRANQTLLLHPGEPADQFETAEGLAFGFELLKINKAGKLLGIVKKQAWHLFIKIKRLNQISAHSNVQTGTVSIGYDVDKFFHCFQLKLLPLIKLVYIFVVQINFTNFIGTIILTILVKTNYF